MCKNYIESRCESGKECCKSHDILHPDVKAKLEKHGIDTKRKPKEMLVDLREAVRGDGNQRGSGDSAQSRGLPRPPTSSESRQMPVQGQAGLPRGRQLSSACPPSAQRRMASGRPGINREILTDQNFRQNVCFFHLRGCCDFGESCRNFHSDLPYQWLYKQQMEVEWRVLPAPINLELELTYSDPVNQEYYMDTGKGVKVIFKTMTGTSVDEQKYIIHRLSTASSVEFERQPLTTEWVWYWKDQIGEWRKYGANSTILTDYEYCDDMTGYKSSISSSDLEQAYIANPEGHLAFCTLGHEYILDFPKMVQRNLEYKTERDVCRRPTFISQHDFEQKKMQRPSGRGSGQMKGAVSSGVGLVAAPSHWNITSGADITDHCQIVEILKKHPSTQKEYGEIEGLFCESMPSTVSVKSIERVENGDLLCNYVSKMARMSKKNNNKDVGEKRLFHGTTGIYVDAICRQGFDFRLSGSTSGTRYGKGSYFATTSKYSDCYTDPSDRVMFVVKVLVGEYVEGNAKYVRPPSKDKTNPCSDLYDSCVDDKSNPKIFVIFDNSGQVYPEYLIRYEYKSV